MAIKKERVDDTVLHVLNNINSRLEKPSTCIQLMFLNFANASSTVQSYKLCVKLSKYKISPSSILWILDCLTSRTQNTDSKTYPLRYLWRSYDWYWCTIRDISLSFPLLDLHIRLYTFSSQMHKKLDKYHADDSLVTGLVTDDNRTAYLHEVKELSFGVRTTTLYWTWERNG